MKEGQRKCTCRWMHTDLHGIFPFPLIFLPFFGHITQHYYCKKKRLAFDNYHRTIKHVALLRIFCRCWHFKGRRVLAVKLKAVRAWGSLDPNFVMPTGCNYFRIFHRRVAAWNKVGRHTCWPKWCGGSWRLQDMWNSLSGNAEVQLPSVFLN